MQLPPAEHEHALNALTECFARERARFLLDAMNERWAALQSRLSQAHSAETAETASQSDSSAASYNATHAARVAPAPPAASAPAHAVSAAQGMGKGSRVVVAGLVSSPEMNGRTGVICGEMSPQTARVTVKIDADGARPSVLGTFSPVNLRVLKHNPSIEWLDENGLICPKNVDFSRQCAKGHALVSFGADGLSRSAHKLMCRVCHVVASSDAQAWSVCSVAGCCGGYAVCGSCTLGHATPVFATPASDEFCLQVFCHNTCSSEISRENSAHLTLMAAVQGVGIPYLKWLRSTMHPSVHRITTSQFCQMYARPRSFRSRRSVADELAACATAHHVGNATWFISHVWNSVFVDTLDAVLLFFEGRDDAATAKVWFDIFVQSQHAGLPGQVSRPPSWCVPATFPH
jgi:hypothetical protein